MNEWKTNHYRSCLVVDVHVEEGIDRGPKQQLPVQPEFVRRGGHRGRRAPPGQFGCHWPSKILLMVKAQLWLTKHVLLTHTFLFNFRLLE